MLCIVNSRAVHLLATETVCLYSVKGLCVAHRQDKTPPSVCVCVCFFCVVFNRQMNIVQFHLHNYGAVVTSRCELLRITEQLDGEVILKHKRRHISWENED